MSIRIELASFSNLYAIFFLLSLVSFFFDAAEESMLNASKKL